MYHRDMQFPWHQRYPCCTKGQRWNCPSEPRTVFRQSYSSQNIVIKLAHINVPRIDVLGQIHQLATLCISENLIRMHPENIGHTVSGACRLHLGPILIPRCKLYIDLNIRIFFFKLLCHCLHARLLGRVPDGECKCNLPL